MNIAVAMPWRDAEPGRREAHERVLAEWARRGYPVYEGDDGSPKFRRGGSRNVAIGKALEAGADIIIVADADCLVEDVALQEAIRYAAGRGLWAYPHDHYVRTLEQGATTTSHGQPTNGGVIVLSRAALERIGLYDPRFLTWGLEDAAYWYVAKTLLPVPLRARGALLELYHARGYMHSRRPTAAETALFNRYRGACKRGDVAAMCALVDEAATQVSDYVLACPPLGVE